MHTLLMLSARQVCRLTRQATWSMPSQKHRAATVVSLMSITVKLCESQASHSTDHNNTLVSFSEVGEQTLTHSVSLDELRLEAQCTHFRNALPSVTSQFDFFT